MVPVRRTCTGAVNKLCGLSETEKLAKSMETNKERFTFSAENILTTSRNNLIVTLEVITAVNDVSFDTANEYSIGRMLRRSTADDSNCLRRAHRLVPISIRIE